MARRQIRRMPVVDQGKHLVGMITLGDLATDRAPGAGDALRRISEPSEPDRSGRSSREGDVTRHGRPTAIAAAAFLACNRRWISRRALVKRSAHNSRNKEAGALRSSCCLRAPTLFPPCDSDQICGRHAAAWRSVRRNRASRNGRRATPSKCHARLKIFWQGREQRPSLVIGSPRHCVVCCGQQRGWDRADSRSEVRFSCLPEQHRSFAS